MILIASGAGMIAEPGTEKYVSVVLLLTLLTGVVHIAFSLLRMGFIVNLLSRPVIYGFMAAAPFIIGFIHPGNHLALDLEQPLYVVNLFVVFEDHFHSGNIYALALGTAVYFFLLV